MNLVLIKYIKLLNHYLGTERKDSINLDQFGLKYNIKSNIIENGSETKNNIEQAYDLFNNLSSIVKMSALKRSDQEKKPHRDKEKTNFIVFSENSAVNMFFDLTEIFIEKIPSP